MQAEAHDKVNLPPGCSFLRDKGGVEGGGWREALVSAGDHLKRALDEYRELGFECLLEKMEAESAPGCGECFKSEGETVYRLYVRPAARD